MKEKKVSIIERILWFLADAEPDVLVEHSERRMTFTWLGILVLLPALIASCLWSYGIYAYTDSLIKGILAGIIGLIVITIVESTLVRTVSKKPNIKPSIIEKIGLYVKRVLLSVLLATLSLAPLHHILFGKQITIEKMNRQMEELENTQSRLTNFHNIESFHDKQGYHEERIKKLEERLHSDSIPHGFNNYGQKKKQYNDLQNKKNQLETEKQKFQRERAVKWSQIPVIEEEVKDKNSREWEIWENQKHENTSSDLLDSLYIQIPLVRNEYRDRTTREWRNYDKADRRFKIAENELNETLENLSNLSNKIAEIQSQYYEIIQKDINYEDSVSRELSKRRANIEFAIEDDVEQYRNELNREGGFVDELIIMFTVLLNNSDARATFILWKLGLLLIDLIPITYKINMRVCSYFYKIYYIDKERSDEIENQYNSNKSTNQYLNTEQRKKREEVIKNRIEEWGEYYDDYTKSELQKELKKTYKDLKEQIKDFGKFDMNGNGNK